MAMAGSAPDGPDGWGGLASSGTSSADAKEGRKKNRPAIALIGVDGEVETVPAEQVEAGKFQRIAPCLGCGAASEVEVRPTDQRTVGAERPVVELARQARLVDRLVMAQDRPAGVGAQVGQQMHGAVRIAGEHQTLVAVAAAVTTERQQNVVTDVLQAILR